MKKHPTLLIAWIISIIATCSSLYLEYALMYPICALCWYQRIALFPLPIILGIACFRKSYVSIPYILPQVAAGIFISSYQLIITDKFSSGKGSCSIDEICSGAFFTFGSYNLPISLLSLATFSLLMAFLLLGQIQNKKTHLT